MATFKLPDPNTATTKSIIGTDGLYYFLQPAQPSIGVAAAWYGSADRGKTLYPVVNATTSPTLDNQQPPLTQAKLTTLVSQQANQAKQAVATQTSQFNTELAKATSPEQLADIQARAQAAGITLNQGNIDRANTLIQQTAARAAAATQPTQSTAQPTQSSAELAAAKARQQQLTSQYQSELAEVKTQTQLDDVLARAQADNITLNQGYVDRANALVQQQVQAQAAAEKAAADAKARSDAIEAQRVAQAQAQAEAQAKQQAEAEAAAEQARAATQASLDAANAKKAEEAAAYQAQMDARQAELDQQKIQQFSTDPAYKAEIDRLTAAGQPFTFDDVTRAVQNTASAKLTSDIAATNQALTDITLPEMGADRATVVEQSNLAALADNPRYSSALAQLQATGQPFSYTDVIRTGDAAQSAKLKSDMAALRAAPTQEMQGGGLGEFIDSDLGKILIVAAIGYALWSSGVFSGFGEAASVGDISAAAEGLAAEGMSSAEIAAELSNTFGIDAAAAETAANLATEIGTGALDAASFLPETITEEMLANAAATGDPIAALNASAGWGATDIGYLQSIGAAPDLIATAGANNIALGYDVYGLNILNAAETAEVLSGVDPSFINFLTNEAAGSAAADAVGTGLTMGSSGLGMTAGTVPGLASMGGAGGLTTAAAGGGVLSELGVFFPGALGLAAISGTLGAGAAAAGVPPGSIVEPPLSPLTPGEPVVSQPVTPVEATPPVPEGPMGPPAPVEAVAPPAPTAPPTAPTELGGFRPGTAPGSPGLGMTPGTGVPPLAEMGGASGLTIPAAGGGTLSAAGVTAAGAGGAALLGNLGSGAAAAGVPEGVISAPVAPTPQPNLTDMGGGQGMNPAAPAETGITAGSAPAAAEMGGAQGLTIPAAGGGTLTEAGVALGAGSGLAGSLGTASEAVATSLPSNTNVPTTSGAVSPGPEVIDRAPDYTNPNPTPDRSVLDQVKDLTGASNLDLLSAGAAAVGAITAPKPPTTSGYGPINYLPFASLKALEPPGANPGLFVRPDAFYNTTSPVQSQYYWGQHPYQSGTTFSQSEYNNVPNAPAVPFGLREMYTPTDLNAYLTQLTRSAGPVAP